MDPTYLSDSDAYGYFRLGLATGLVDRLAPIAWADRQIMSDRPLTSEILELSLSGRQPYSQLIRLLTICHPSLDYDLPLFMLLGLCSECLACVYACGVGAIDHNMFAREYKIDVGAVILAPGYQA